MDNKRVLFVDDEINILQGLRRTLREMHKEWDMAFVSSGNAALDRLAERPFDVIVSDMRMPGMDGAQLLNEVKRLHPSVVRIILSGYADHELIMSSLGATHQFLSKPCSAEALKAAVERAFDLNRLFEQEPSIKPLISRIDALPSVPALYVQITQELRSESPDIQKIGQIIAQDPAMTAKILQIVNSTFFGHTAPLVDPVRAVKMLGVEMIRTLVLSAHLFDQSSVSGQSNGGLSRLWQHGSMVGRFAERIAHSESASETTRSDAQMAGTLHDIGQLLLFTNLPKEYKELLQMSQRENADLFELERMYFGATHAEIGAYLLGLWGLPTPIVHAVANHHRCTEADRDHFSASTAVYAANVLEEEILAQGLSAEETFAADGIEGFDDRIPDWRRVCLESLADDAPPFPSHTSLEAHRYAAN